MGVDLRSKYHSFSCSWNWIFFSFTFTFFNLLLNQFTFMLMLIIVFYSLVFILKFSYLLIANAIYLQVCWQRNDSNDKMVNISRVWLMLSFIQVNVSFYCISLHFTFQRWTLSKFQSSWFDVENNVKIKRKLKTAARCMGASHEILHGEQHHHHD